MLKCNKNAHPTCNCNPDEKAETPLKIIREKYCCNTHKIACKNCVYDKPTKGSCSGM